MLVDPTQYLPREQLAQLRQLNPLRSMGALLWTWGWIVACFALYVRYPSALSVVVAWVVMSGRHLALAILMHDGAHGLLLGNKRWNDRLGQWLTAYPTLTDMLLYRKVHFEHHRHTWTERDPDRALATPFPVSTKSFLRKMLRDLTGQTAFKRLRVLARYAGGLDPLGLGREGRSVASVVGTFVRRQYPFLIINGLLLGGCALAGHPEAYLLIWWLPQLTGFQVVLRIRSIAEHACIPDPADPLRNTRTTLAPGWLRFLIAPHHVNYHLEHHLFMTVPHYNLPRAHCLLAEAGVLARAEVAAGYGQVLRAALGRGESSQPPQA